MEYFCCYYPLQLTFPASLLLTVASIASLLVDEGDALHLVSVGSQVPLGPHLSDRCVKDVHKVNGGHFLNSTIAESKYETYCLAKTICQFRHVGFPTHFNTRWNT